jgi:hypothetical protein
MTQKLSRKASTDEIMKSGAFRAVRHFVETGAMTKEQASRFTAEIYEFFLLKTCEAKNEIRRIEAVLNRIEQICRAGKIAKPWIPNDPSIDRLGRDVMAFDGWVMSLYETDLTLVGVGAPHIVHAKPFEMWASREKLWEKRLEKLHLGLKIPELFVIN